jgi:hypothetical protein
VSDTTQPIEATPNPAPQTTWEKIRAAFKHSVTILWARVVAISGLLIGGVQALSINPTIDSAVHQILQPKFIPYYIIGIGLITEMARRRTAGK